MSDGNGTFEHADHSEPRRGDGYCTDDMARLLVVTSRQPRPSPAIRELGRTCLTFLSHAQGVSGKVRNRQTAHGRWRGRRGVEDCWGRSLWALGTAAHLGPENWTRQRALACFDRGLAQRSPWRRSMAFAALGAAEVLEVIPDHAGARLLLADAADAIGPVGTDASWPWPEPRLTYANAALPEALLAAGDHLSRPDVVEDGLTLLAWLLDRETVGGHLSPTPVDGADPGDVGARFDQQPIEVAAMADACARAEAVTGDPAWRDGIEMAIDWFLGDNDAGAEMWDPVTGGSYDGLHVDGPNLNQGTESTIALISTFQHGDRIHAPTPAAV